MFSIEFYFKIEEEILQRAKNHIEAGLQKLDGNRSIGS